MDTTLLPAAIKGDRRSLSADARKEILALNGARPWAFTWQLVRAWLVIAGAIGGALYLHTWWATLLAIVIVATRHNVLGLLVHEQTHLLGYRGRYGDLIVNLFAAYPLLLLTVEDYAQVHLAHHRDYLSPTDPDFLRKSGEDWSVPKSRAALARIFVADLLGINTLKLIRGKRVEAQNAAFVRRHRVPRWVRPLYFVCLAVTLTVVSGWGIFLLYWVLPLVTLSQLIIRWGALCEHKYNLPGATVADSTPLILLSRWERLLMPNLNFAMHAYHHYFPGISFAYLPKVHQIYAREGLIDDQHVFHGYAAYLRYITTPPAVTS